MSKKRHADDLSGKGSKEYGGRWNKAGIPALYLAENISLAILETIVHCQFIGDLYNRLLISVKVPDNSIKRSDTKTFPDNWNSTPWHDYTIETGTEWLNSQDSLMLKIPSAIALKENIYVVNPRHGDFTKVKIIGKDIFEPNNRLVLKPM